MPIELRFYTKNFVQPDLVFVSIACKSIVTDGENFWLIAS
ncbi:MAG: hypothetical protein RIS47_1511 [Bacteroidota bacterium]|jgi:hypothetical protein